MSWRACTIIARNYLPFARVLARSYAEHHPGSPLAVLVLDDRDRRIGPDEPFELLRPSDLGEDPDELVRMTAMYDLVELATALKPWLLELLLDRGASAAMYLDPDMRLFAPLGDVFELADAHGPVLTPHLTSPIPRDGRTVEETSILAAGVYNLGFCAVGRGSGDFLAYWRARLRRDCINEPVEMRFVDQRWVDFVPGIFDCTVLGDRGVNAAYWNLHDRPISRSPAGWAAGRWPLRLFHFSGYSPAVPHLLSRHQGERPRILLSAHPDLRRLCADYRDELVGAGFGVDDREPYGWRQAANGLPLDRITRRSYRHLVLSADAGRRPQPPDPFADDGAERLVDLLNGPSDDPADPGHLSTYLRTLYAEQPALYREFPDPQWRDRPRYLAWARAEAAAGRIDGRLVPGEPPAPTGSPSPRSAAADLAPDPAREPAWGPPDRLHPGILVAGEETTGFGEDVRALAGVVGAAGLVVSAWTEGPQAGRRGAEAEAEGGGGRPPAAPAVRRDLDVNLVAVEPDRVGWFMARVGPGFLAGRTTVGRWGWGPGRADAGWDAALGLVGEVWATSTFAQEAIAARTEKPVFAFPPAVVVPPVDPGLGRAELGLPADRMLVLTSLDLDERYEQANPDATVAAFRRAFRPAEGPLLVVETRHGDRRAVALERLRVLVADQPDVVVLDEPGRAGRHGALLVAADCYVSLHRSVAFGPVMAEAMAVGRPVVATGHSGNLDFMTPDTALLVPWTAAAGPPGVPPSGAARPAEPDVPEAARLLRGLAERPGEGAALGERARAHMAARHRPEARAAFVAERFRAIQEGRAEQVRAAAAAAERPPAPAVRSAAGRLRRAARGAGPPPR